MTEVFPNVKLAAHFKTEGGTESNLTLASVQCTVVTNVVVAEFVLVMGIGCITHNFCQSSAPPAIAETS